MPPLCEAGREVNGAAVTREVKGAADIEALLWAVRLETDASGAQLDTLSALVKALVKAGAVNVSIEVR